MDVTVAAPAPATATLGSAQLVAGISEPEYGDKIYTGDDTYTIMGYALDQAATINQGSQGTGIDRVQVYINDSYIGDADLAYSDARAAMFGSQFANAGFRFTFKPTSLHEGNTQLEIRARSAMTGKEITIPTTFNIIEGKPNS